LIFVIINASLYKVKNPLTPPLSQRARESNFPSLPKGEGTGVRGL